jgi:hypothetical protein
MHGLLTQDAFSISSDTGAFDAIADLRKARRGGAILPLTISADGNTSVGLLRDVSTAGMFFYAKIAPKIGSELRVLVHPSAADCGVTICCKCKVIRVEPGVAGAATGIGVTIEGYDANEECQPGETTRKQHGPARGRPMQEEVKHPQRLLRRLIGHCAALFLAGSFTSHFHCRYVN